MPDHPQQSLAAPFPAPPPFYHHFTKPNLAQLRRIQKDTPSQPQPNGNSNSNGASDSKPSIDILTLPSELRYLLPPPPPSSTYRSFGAHISLSAPELTLADAGIEQLYPSEPPSSESRAESEATTSTKHLLALARSMLTTYLALVGTLSVNAELFGDRVDELQTIGYNMHDLINQYRPHQARETLVLMMEDRVERMREEIRGVREGRGKVEEVMREFGKAGAGDEERGVEVEGMGEKGRDEVEKERQRSKWRAMEGWS